jgi:hypothetical protein
LDGTFWLIIWEHGFYTSHTSLTIADDTVLPQSMETRHECESHHETNLSSIITGFRGRHGGTDARGIAAHGAR